MRGRRAETIAAWSQNPMGRFLQFGQMQEAENLNFINPRLQLSNVTSDLTSFHMSSRDVNPTAQRVDMTLGSVHKNFSPPSTRGDGRKVFAEEMQNAFRRTCNCVRRFRALAEGANWAKALCDQ